MLNTYCAGCGAVNQIGDNLCVACGANLAVQPAFATATGARDWPQHATGWPQQAPEWQPLRDPSRPLPGINSFGIVHVIAASMRLFARHLWLITRIVFVVVAPFEIVRELTFSWAVDWQTKLLTLLLGALCHVLIAPALVYALMKFLETGKAPGLNESFRWGLTKIWPLAVCAAISWVLQAAGYMLCIVPGIIVSMTLALVFPVAILENGSPAMVLKRSSQLTRGHRFEILLAEMVFGLMALVLLLLVTAVTVNTEATVLNIFVAILTDIFEQAFTVLSLVLYLTLLRTPQQGLIRLFTN